MPVCGHWCKGYCFVLVWPYCSCCTFALSCIRQAEEQLRIVEEQRKIHEERMKLEQDRQRQQKEEQKIILGKGKSRPKLSFSLKATEWDCSPFVHMSRPAFIPIQLSLLIVRSHSSSVEHSLRFGSAERWQRKRVQPAVWTCLSLWRPMLFLPGLKTRQLFALEGPDCSLHSPSSPPHRWLLFVLFFSWFYFNF